VYREHTFLTATFYSRYTLPKVSVLELTKFLLFFIFFFLLSTSIKSQNADCTTLLKLTDTIYHSPAISNFGNVKEFSENQLENMYAFENEKNSIWYLITMPDSGIFTFDIVPESPNDDWDFLLYEHKKMFCKRIEANKIQPIRSNLSRSSQTGLSVKSSQKFIGAGINNKYSKAVLVQKGEEFVLVVNNPKKSGKKHTLSLHYPKAESTPILEKRDSTITPKAPTIQFKLAIKSVKTNTVVAANVTIDGFDKKPISLEGITGYETTLTKQTHNAIINIASKGYMLTSIPIKVTKNKVAVNKEVFLEEIKIGEKVNLKKIQFYGASPRFLPTAKSALTALLSFMQLNENVKIEIEGHVNGPGQRNSKDYQVLSDNRAKAVKNYLIENGIDANRLSFIGYGNTQMLFPKANNPRDMSANRRVEIKILAK